MFNKVQNGHSTMYLLPHSCREDKSHHVSCTPAGSHSLKTQTRDKEFKKVRVKILVRINQSLIQQLLVHLSKSNKYK